MGNGIRAVCIVALISFTASSFMSLPVYADSAETQQNTSTTVSAATTVPASTTVPAATTAPASTTVPAATTAPVSAPMMASTTPRSMLSNVAMLIAAAMNAAMEAVAPVPDPAVEEEKQWYREKIPMKKEHQKLLWEYCKNRKLSYIDMLALISVESNFNEKCSSASGTYKGYFQLGKGHWANLAKTLGTANNPLDGAISIKWGTAFYSWILQDKRVKDLPEEKKRDVALSIYQRGPIGYDKYGLSTAYLKAYYNKRNKVVAIFAEEQQ